MEGQNIEKLNTFIKSLGFEDSEIAEISNSEDYEPFLNKLKDGFKSQLITDQSFIDEISKPHKDAVFGKVKQLSKIVRKEYGLDIAESELEKIEFSELLKKAREKDKSQKSVDENSLSKKYTELLEEFEDLKASIPERERQIVSTWEERLKESEARENFSKIVEADPMATKENISYLTDTISKLIKAEGRKLIIDEKKTVHYVGMDNVPIRDEKGAVITPKKLVSNFLTMVNSSTYKTSGGNSQKTSISDGDNLLSLLGAGI